MSVVIGEDAQTSLAVPRNVGRYDGFTITLHWLTAVLVIALFALAEIWNNFVARGTPVRHSMQLLHVSLGLALAAVFVVRLAWRTTRGRSLPHDRSNLPDLLASAMHVVLYLLLTAQIVLGFLYRWAQGEEFTFFGLFTVPPAFAPDRALAHTFDTLHYDAAWIIIVLAFGHAMAALVHHYLLRDGILRRMLPGATR